MKQKKPIDPSLLEGHVKDLLSNAKNKMNSLNSDIEVLSRENDDLQDLVQKAADQKREILDKNAQLGQKLRQVRAANQHLAKQKAELQLQLTQAKADLALLIDNSERQKAEIQKQISALEETERRLKETRMKERNDFLEAEKNDRRKIEMLQENIVRKEHEIKELKSMLTELVHRQASRETELESEAKVFKEFVEQKGKL